ncbi:hypothetical protein N7G274_006117 [Stereocaulon virgatum]|uniref:Tcp11-domain-containing protein n=1 Tax=Stereocaulon virgatum TaxID=373712 RepID=A0ABR4A663_9LECA
MERGLSHTPDPGDEVADSMHPTISEEVSDLIMSSDGEAPGTYNPPPHIAARIYRNSTSRRKSSAASSRRNSMSSHHSGRSMRSAHGGAQSTHVAQHLRRASIIQSRKDKAADRNAHAERVRLRAAINKAAPRVSTNSEERALAAQQARERYLARVKANCAEEVKRSKRVAEEQREKRAAEHIKLKEDMEERHAEAEKRKALLQQTQRRPRTVSSPTVEGKKTTVYVWKPRNKAEAAKIIQNYWQKRQRRVIIQEFLRLGLTVEAVQKTSFEEVGALLAQDNVLACTSKMLKLCGLKQMGDDDIADKAAVRMFLSTFLVLGHPAQVLSKEGEQEHDLISKAKDLLVVFNQIIENSPHTSTLSLTAQLSELSEAYMSFQGAFAAWKSHDSSYLVSNMVAQFVELDAIWQTVKDDVDGAVAADYKEGIQQNQTLVLVRLKRLLGPEKAKKMIQQAIRASRKARSKKHSTPDTTPRATPSEPNAAASASDLPAARSLDPSIETSTGDLSAKQRLEATTLLPSNRHIMHELAINQKYTIDLEPRQEVRDRIVEKVRYHMNRNLETVQRDAWIPLVAEVIQAKLLRLLTPAHSLHALVSEALDPKMVEIQVKNGAFSYDKFFSFMNSIIPRLCAPVRDAEVKDLADNPSQDPVQQLARVYYIIDLIALDHLNYVLIKMAPTLLKEHVGYEKNAFSKRLGGQPPVKTLKWWKASIDKINHEPPRQVANGGSLSAPTPSFKSDKIYKQGLVDLAITISNLKEVDVPETLELDIERLTRIRSDTLRIITVASILLTAKNLLRRDVRSLWKFESQRMWDLPFSSPPASFVSIVESRYALPPTTKQQLTGTITRLISDARERQVSHPVMKVLLKKIQTHVLARLAASSAEERIRTSTTASEVLGSSGMPEFVARIGDIVQELSRVAAVDGETHGEWYDKAAHMVAQEAEGSS